MVINMAYDLRTKIRTEFNRIYAGQDENPLFLLRKEALNRFEETNFPNLKNEEWKYTNVSFVNKHDFTVSLDNHSSPLSEAEILPFIFANIHANLLTFVNGFYSKELSKIITNNSGIKICSLSDAIATGDQMALLNASQSMIFSQDAFSAVNISLWQDGAYIFIPDNTVIDEPVHILQLNDTRNSPVLSNPRNLIIVGENSHCKVIESAFNIGQNPGFTNSVTEIYLGDTSVFDYNKLQNDDTEHYYIGSSYITQHRNTVFNSSTISLKGTFTRNNLTSVLTGTNSESHFNGFYFMDGKDFVDNHTLADHALPYCTSNENYRGILDNEARAVFNGKIIVRPNAQKTIAYQSNKNILLSDEAVINTKPQLEIFADDVKCSHGATSGFLDKNALFYLLSRGISQEKARAILLNAFASEIFDKINIPGLKENLKLRVAERLNLSDVFIDEALEHIND